MRFSFSYRGFLPRRALAGAAAWLLAAHLAAQSYTPTPIVGPGGGGAAPAAQSAPDIHDIHGPMLLTYWEQHGRQVIGGSVATVVGLGLLLWLSLRRKPKPPLTPIERARLEIASAHALLVTGQDKAFAIKVSDAVRRYLEDAYHLPAPERTTEEFLQEAAGHEWLRGDLTVLLRRFLEFCDLAKFAGQQFGPAEREQLHAAASEFVEAADKLLHPPKSANEENGAPKTEEGEGDDATALPAGSADRGS
jgi:hypothetical protein